jgi:hypothetical protein
MNKMACLWFALCVVVGGFLFLTTQRVNDGRQHLVLLTQAIQTEEESLRVLQAEWSYLNQPDRLEKLSREYLQLSPMKGQQFARTASIPLRPQPAVPESETDALMAAAAMETPEILTAAAASAPRVPVRKPPLRNTVVRSTPIPAAAASAHAVTTATPPKAADTPRTAGGHRDFSDVINALGVAGR